MSLYVAISVSLVLKLVFLLKIYLFNFDIDPKSLENAIILNHMQRQTQFLVSEIGRAAMIPYTKWLLYVVHT